jgi:hypothetical protein
MSEAENSGLPDLSALLNNIPGIFGTVASATPTLGPIIAQHEAEIRRLGEAKQQGEIDQLEFLAQASPHANIIAALEREQVRDQVLHWVRVGLANPAIVEAVAVGAAHWLGSLKRD